MTISKSWKDSYIYSDKFEDRKFGAELINYDNAQALSTTDIPQIPPGTPAYIAALYRYPTLNLKGEWTLFMKMNYAKHIYNKLVKTGRDKPRQALMLKTADETRKFIATHNLRLVMTIAKKYLKSGASFDEYISSGNLTLLKAIDKFDANRGSIHKDTPNKFSTYASWSLINNFSRDMSHLRELTFTDYTENDFNPIASLIDKSSLVDKPDPLNDDIKCLMRIVDALPYRERLIIKSRFGINCEETTLDKLGAKLKVTKERVRQIQRKAMERVKEMATSTIG